MAIAQSPQDIGVDGEVGFVTGLCVGRMWVGDPARNIAPWRDTGVGDPRACGRRNCDERSPGVGARRAAASPRRTNRSASRAPAGDVSLRIVSSEPATAGMLRLDQLVAAIARSTLWLTDAYYVGIPPYVQALRAAAQDGVDVRLLVPNASDIPILKPFSRAGYRALLEAGVRVFEWNGTMLHAKTAVADGVGRAWARPISTSRAGSATASSTPSSRTAPSPRRWSSSTCAISANATEVVLADRRKVCARATTTSEPARLTRGSGSTSGVAAGALRIGQACRGAVVTDRRMLGPVEGATLERRRALCCACCRYSRARAFPRMVAYPASRYWGLWGGLALLWRALRLRRSAKPRPALDEKRVQCQRPLPLIRAKGEPAGTRDMALWHRGTSCREPAHG